MKVKVPVIWGTDAVHGHNNVYGATLFPHNIGLGAAHDPQLMARIGHATAEQVRATGISWAFAPTLAVVQNPRWGRTYESYSSDPALVRSYGEAMVRGLQGQLGSSTSVLATAKHYLGDGGTFHGKDQGETRTTEANLAPYSCRRILWRAEGERSDGDGELFELHRHFDGQALGQDARQPASGHGRAEGRLGFDGLVVSDWNAIGQLPGCTNWHCPQAINAGVDLIMVPDDWKKFIGETVADVRAGRIPMSRIDDAVSRIIRVKMEAGLFKASPATGPHPDASGTSFARSSRARARGSPQVARALEERSRRPAASCGGQDPGRWKRRRQPSDAVWRVVTDLAGRQNPNIRLP